MSAPQRLIAPPAFEHALGDLDVPPVASAGDHVRLMGIVAQTRKRFAGFGWTDGRNVRMDFRWGGGGANRIRALAQELVGLQPLTTYGAAATAAVQRETRTIPIVITISADPVASGIVPRLDRLSGNITGFANLEASLAGKWLELLAEIAPGLKRAATMFNPDTAPASAYMPSLERSMTPPQAELSTIEPRNVPDAVCLSD